MITKGNLLKLIFIIFPVTCYAQDLDIMGKPAQFGLATPQRPVELPDVNNSILAGFSGKTALKVLSSQILGDSTLNVRGRRDIAIYQNASPSVVLVVTNEGMGSGSYLGSNLVLTNAHVVGANQYAGVVFKPQQEGAKVSPSSVITAKLLRIDRTRDLAVLSVETVPAYVSPLALGTGSEIKIGADVYAIGHPTGQFWTFTRGLISQFRKGFEWKGQAGTHRADVIQTQTPINPGNSGGPLIGESGKLIGVNSFKASDAEGINFAVSVDDVVQFLNPANKAAEPKSALTCKPARLYDGRNKENNARTVQIDTNCDGIADMFFVTPDDNRRAVQALIDSNYDGKIDVVVDDFNRDNLWDVSFYDTEFNGTITLVGFHPNGDIKPSWFEKYATSRAYAQYFAKAK